MAGVSFKSAYHGQFSMWRIVASGGRLPDELSGMYTHPDLAQQAIDRYFVYLEERLAKAAPKKTRGRNGAGKSKQAIQDV